MFHWICPECGREIAPTVRECPACDPNAVAAEPALVGVVEAPTARSANDAAPTGHLEAAAVPAAAPAADTAPAGHVEAAAVPAAAPAADTAPTLTFNVEGLPSGVWRRKQARATGAVPTPTPEVPLERKTADAPLAQAVEAPPTPSARTAAPETPAVPAVQHTPQSVEPILPQLDASPADNPLQHLSDMLPEPEKPAEPPRAEQEFPISAPSPAVPRALRALMTALGPAAEQPRSPVTGSSQAKPTAEPPLVRSTVDLPRKRARNMIAIPARPLNAAPAELATPAGKPTQPSTPFAGPAPALAPLTNYSPLKGRPMRPAVPDRKALKGETAPRITLPGPMLTPRLVKFQDRELNPVMPERRLAHKRLLPGWVASMLIIGTVLGLGFSSLFSIVPRGGEAKATATQVEAAETPSSAVPTADSSNSLARAIEVTGIRIPMDPAKEPEIQYLVVNHTANRFSGVTVYVTLHAAHEPSGRAPLGKFQFAAPDLGPYESKEMSSAIERVNRPVNMPAWQDLRAEVEIGQ